MIFGIGFRGNGNRVSIFVSGVTTYFPGFPPFAISPRPRFKRPTNNSPGHIAVVSSPFLYNNQVKLKSPRPPQYQKEDKSKVIFNLIKRKQNEPPLLRRQKRWVPFNPYASREAKTTSPQFPQEDSFLSFIKRKPGPRPANKIPSLDTISDEPLNSPVKSVEVEDLLTRISSVPQNRFQMHGIDRPQGLQQRPNTFRNERPSLSQMQFNRQTPSIVQSQEPSSPVTGSDGNPPYWLNPLYLAAILQQNNRPPYVILNPSSAPASVSTSCGPKGCSAAAAAGSASSTSSSSGAQVSPSRPVTTTSRPTTRPPTRPPARPPIDNSQGGFGGSSFGTNSGSGSTRPVSNGNTDTSSSSGSLQNVNNNGRMLALDFRQKRAPTEATSLQSMLAHHRIDLNVLKTSSQIRPATPKLSSPEILTPIQRRHYQDLDRSPAGIRTQNQRPLPDKFYTNSDIFPQFSRPPSSSDTNSKQVISERFDLGEPEPKKTSFRDTAIIALKLSQSIMNLYKTVSPYFSSESAAS